MLWDQGDLFLGCKKSVDPTPPPHKQHPDLSAQVLVLVLIDWGGGSQEQAPHAEGSGGPVPAL